MSLMSGLLLLALLLLLLLAGFVVVVGGVLVRGVAGGEMGGAEGAVLRGTIVP